MIKINIRILNLYQNLWIWLKIWEDKHPLLCKNCKNLASENDDNYRKNVIVGGGYRFELKCNSIDIYDFRCFQKTGNTLVAEELARLVEMIKNAWKTKLKSLLKTRFSASTSVISVRYMIDMILCLCPIDIPNIVM